jgi:predicted phage gp36 major capsid-like protein
MKEVIEKLDTIEAQQVAKIEEMKSEVAVSLETVKAEMSEKFEALEAKVASVQAPALIKTYKSLTQELNRSVKEQLNEFVKSNSRMEKEIKVFASDDQYDAYIKEASGLGNPAGYGSGYNVGGRIGYDPVFVSLRQTNPFRGVSRQVSTDGSAYQFRAKTGNAGAAWGYAIQNNGAATTQDTNIWQLVLKDLNCAFPVRTATLDDIDGLESNIVSDMLAEFSQSEGRSMAVNNDQSNSAPFDATGGTNGLRGLSQYGYASTYAGGTVHPAAYGSTGVATSDGLSTVTTYDQITTNGTSTTANNITYADIINFQNSLPTQYRSSACCFMINPIQLQAIRGLVDDNGRPIYIDGLARPDGFIGSLLGFDVVVNQYLNQPNDNNDGRVDLFPMFFGDFNRGHCIVDRLNMILRRYDQTQVGFITFYGEKRIASSVVDPFALVAYRSTHTAN